ncbi:MAG: hypothetical protein RLZZ592_2095 [Pseudomonadota bacterium]|jgi:CelD/BcsL family acetyltransferase involved in cellulose biosynthesis
MLHTKKSTSLSSISIEIVDSTEKLDRIEAAWRELQARSAHRSVFTTVDYIRTAWACFHTEQDQMLVLALREQGRLVAIAPFIVSHLLYMHIPSRVIDWLAEWEGDRPGLLCEIDPSRVWERLGHFFQSEYKDWDLLRLHEQAAPLDEGNALVKASHVETAVDSIGFHVPLQGSFDDYLQQIDTKVKSNWRNRSKKVLALSPVFERIDRPTDMAAAVDRFIALERMSWKGDTSLGVGLGKDARHRHFYAELCRSLAERGQAAFHFMRTGEQDIAATLLFLVDGVVYERHIAYNPEFAHLSPGIVLRTELMKTMFGAGWHEFDLMGMQPSIGRQRHKQDWATGRRDTISQQFFHRTGRLLPLFAARRMRDWLHLGHTEDKSAADTHPA